MPGGFGTSLMTALTGYAGRIQSLPARQPNVQQLDIAREIVILVPPDPLMARECQVSLA